PLQAQAVQVGYGDYRQALCCVACADHLFQRIRSSLVAISRHEHDVLLLTDLPDSQIRCIQRQPQAGEGMNFQVQAGPDLPPVVSLQKVDQGPEMPAEVNVRQNPPHDSLPGLSSTGVV